MDFSNSSYLVNIMHPLPYHVNKTLNQKLATIHAKIWTEPHHPVPKYCQPIKKIKYCQT